MLTDSHCHLDKIKLDQFDDDFNNIISAATEADVSRFLCVCIDLERFDDVHQIAQKYPQIYCSVGVHPTSENVKEPSIDDLITLAKSDRVIAIGETGLDYFRVSDEDRDMEWQRERFRVHIHAAKKTQKPLIIHTRSAKDDTLKILAEEGADSVGGVMHCFAEDWETAQKSLALNFYISFSGIVTFNSAKELQRVAQQVPEDRILIETDSPWLAPVPKRGKSNQPAYVKYVAEKVADLRGDTYENIAKISSDNFERLFKVS
ncbi:MAG TPA: TatD family deoxyribonuclease [Leucothrix mucor]|nr:TatD family deoxyribonuclease [Leucothrix mucor]